MTAPARVIDLSFLTTTDGFIIQGDTVADQAGRSVSNAGDVNGDGIGDVIVGARRGDDGGTDAGEAYVIYGRRPADAVTLTGTDIKQTILGGDFNDTLDGGGGNDNLDGGLGEDDLDGGSGAGETFDGGANDDEVIFDGDQAEFTVVTSGAITTVTEIATGHIVSVLAVETLVFDDGNVVL